MPKKILGGGGGGWMVEGKFNVQQRTKRNKKQQIGAA